MPTGTPLNKDEMIQKLRQIDQAVENGKPVGLAYQDAGLTQSTYNRWKRRLAKMLPELPQDRLRPRRRRPARRRGRRRLHRGEVVAPPVRTARGNGHGPAPSGPGTLVPDRRLALQRENAELRDIVVDQARLIARLQKGSRN